MHLAEVQGICKGAVLASELSPAAAKLTLHPCSLLELLTHPTPVEIQLGTLAGPGCFLTPAAAEKRGITDSFLSQLVLCFVGVSTTPSNPSAVDDWACVGETKLSTLFSVPGAEKYKSYANYWNKQWTNEGGETAPKKSLETSLGMLSPLDAVGELSLRTIVEMYGQMTMGMREVAGVPGMSEKERTAAERRVQKRGEKFVWGFQEMFVSVGMGMLYGAMVRDETGSVSSKVADDSIAQVVNKYALGAIMDEPQKKAMIKYLKFALKELQKRGKRKNKESDMLIPYPDSKAHPELANYRQMSLLLLMELLFASPESKLAGINAVSPLSHLGDLLDGEEDKLWLEVLSPLSPLSFAQRLLPDGEKRAYSQRLTANEVQRYMEEAHRSELAHLLAQTAPESAPEGDATGEEPDAKRPKGPREEAHRVDASAFVLNLRGLDDAKRSQMVRAQVRVAFNASEEDLAAAASGGGTIQGVTAANIKEVCKFYRVYFSYRRFQDKSMGMDPVTRTRRPPLAILPESEWAHDGVYADGTAGAPLVDAYRAQLQRDLGTDTSKFSEELMQKIASDGLAVFRTMQSGEWPTLEGPCLLNEPQVLEPGPMRRRVTQTLEDSDDKKPVGGHVPAEDRDGVGESPSFEGNVNFTPFAYNGTRAFLVPNSYSVMTGESGIANIALRVFSQSKGGSKFGVRVQQRGGRGSSLAWTCHNRALVHNRAPGSSDTRYEAHCAPPEGLYGRLKRERDGAMGEDGIGDDEQGYYSA